MSSSAASTITMRQPPVAEVRDKKPMASRESSTAISVLSRLALGSTARSRVKILGCAPAANWCAVAEDCAHAELPRVARVRRA